MLRKKLFSSSDRRYPSWQEFDSSTSTSPLTRWKLSTMSAYRSRTRNSWCWSGHRAVKSTCLRMVAGLEEPSAGRIYIGDRLVNGVDPKDRNIAMVFQNYALYPHMNVFDNVAFGLKLRHVPAQEINRRVQEAAEVLGLEQLLKRKPKQLSGGQRQRVALGRAIVRQADVFLM